MTREEIAIELDKLGIYYDPDHPDHISREKIDELSPPFMEWGTQDNYIRADGINYLVSKRLIVRIYNEDNEDHVIETPSGATVDEVIEASFDRYSKVQYYNDDMSLYETNYMMEV